MRMSGIRWVLLCLSLLLLLGCDQSSSEDDVDGDSSEGQADMTLRFEDQEVGLFFADVETIDMDGVDVVSMAALVDSGLAKLDPPQSRGDLFFDFEASDGFRSSSVDCELVAGAMLDQGSVAVDSKNLFWEEAAEMRGCYRLDAAAAFLAYTDANPPEDGDEDGDEETADGDADITVTNPISVTVDQDGQTATVALGDLTWFASEGAAVVSLTDVAAASQIVTTPQSVTFEPEASDGYKPSDNNNDPLVHADWSQGFIGVESGNVGFPESADIPKCYHVKDATILHFYAASTR